MTISSVANAYTRAVDSTIAQVVTDESQIVADAVNNSVVVEPAVRSNSELIQPEQLKEWQDQLLTQRKLEFSIDEDSGRNVVKVIDSDSGDVIRQFPSEEVLKLSSVAKSGKGGLFAEEA
ncbi:flagellar protein FlaG [Paraperlucidibaca sp.]|jgi:flagellar protein FlaG|uniref:flagellar protein FlaG n=1 Tax=Paraperlucidibaca sp. TaxID=2708021 RepID=UPI0030F3CF83|tara:strand:- start:1647 stop:2006 length:360 start_codon:yes stop_codon:yes gene_type:complete